MTDASIPERPTHAELPTAPVPESETDMIRRPKFHCPNCQERIPTEVVSSWCGTLSYARRKTKPTGAPEVLRECEYGCGQSFGARAMKEHIKTCPTRVKQSGGRPKLIRACPNHCGFRGGFKERLEHLLTCPKRKRKPVGRPPKHLPE